MHKNSPRNFSAIGGFKVCQTIHVCPGKDPRQALLHHVVLVGSSQTNPERVADVDERKQQRVVHVDHWFLLDWWLFTAMVFFQSNCWDTHPALVCIIGMEDLNHLQQTVRFSVERFRGKSSCEGLIGEPITFSGWMLKKSGAARAHHNPSYWIIHLLQLILSLDVMQKKESSDPYAGSSSTICLFRTRNPIIELCETPSIAALRRPSPPQNQAMVWKHKNLDRTSHVLGWSLFQFSFSKKERVINLILQIVIVHPW